ncbi:enoyl-CoA hydratase/isomerase family protein [Psychromarinibacter sp. C21-152]|uniref:Enoyl-CoA hydratase/isomerase family protein n=1 Tax=Psychromarinibacter sediminicola TaxID=3033385 RepID=A0AAE3NPG7_9RHOB|nr:enoyl-CoA hydratase/isomerase family protein [Psychromarinibacter sediminicola]MDF0599607.1 enoyl-CoA hydratase/isomerase family protein [Psychromarinibacter sediminicola]
MSEPPAFEMLTLSRRGRRLDITLNRPEAMNAFGKVMHAELVDALRFAAGDDGSDVIVLTGAGKAFSAGGDLARIEEFQADPSEFDREAEDAKRIVFTLLDIEKPVIARLNGAAVGLGATLALLCDVIFAADHAKIGDPHVTVGLVAGDGGAVIWPQLIGFARAKEYLMTGRLLTAAEAAEIGLINHAVPAAELDARVDAFCDELLGGSTQAIRWTKTVVNLELKRIAHALMDPGIAYESLSVRSEDHARAVRAMRQEIARKKGG